MLVDTPKNQEIFVGILYRYFETVTEPRKTEPRKTEPQKTERRKTKLRMTEPRMTEPRKGSNLE
jgi:hypothetical protein